MSGFVYFIQRGTDGPIKIGHSENPIGRMSTLQVGCADRLRLLGSMTGSVETERALLALASHLRRPIYALNLGSLKGDEDLIDAVMGAPAHCLLLIEDIDF